MVCRHSAGDPACGSNRYYKSPDNTSPDNTKFHITKAVQCGNHLVLEVTYPNCIKCSYEGRKVMVFRAASALDALKWKTIDPHFREPKNEAYEAPSPEARFPASELGWKDAIRYAQGI